MSTTHSLGRTPLAGKESPAERWFGGSDSAPVPPSPTRMSLKLGTPGESHVCVRAPSEKEEQKSVWERRARTSRHVHAGERHPGETGVSAA